MSARPDRREATTGGWGGLARRPAVAVVMTLLLAACASDKPKPAALQDLTPRIAGRQAWQLQLEPVSFDMVPVVRDGKVVVAGDTGIVTAVDVLSGRPAWEVRLGTRLSAGVGSDGRYSAVVTRDNELVALEEGRVAWRTRLPARTVTPPLVAGERIFVMSVNRVVHAFDAAGGQRLWTFDRPGDSLTLGQPGVLSAFKNTLLVGQGPRLTGLDPLRGTVRWEVPLATPRGTNEVERLADLVGPATRVGNLVCARAFQASVACADADRGTLAWTRNTGGWQPPGGDDQVVVGADASDRLTAWKLLSGELVWTSELLLNRRLAGVAVAGRVAVAGDSEGYVHFLDKLTGEPLLRLPTDGSAVAAVPALAGTTLIVVTRKGGVYAFRPE